MGSSIPQLTWGEQGAASIRLLITAILSRNCKRYLKTTSAKGEPVKITQALQETHLAMNQEGARAKSAVALEVRITSTYSKTDLVIDGPVLVWFQRPGLTKPRFVGYITEEDWKNPGEIKGA